MADEAAPPSVRTPKSADVLADYLVEIGVTLASYGCPSYRLEDVVRAIAEEEGYRAEPFALPTGFFLSLAPARGETPPLQRMARVDEHGTDLGRLTAIDKIFNDVLAKRATLEQGRVMLRELVKEDRRYPAWLRWLAIGAVSGATAVFFSGGLVEVCAAMLCALFIHAFSNLVSRHPSGRFLVDFFGGFVAAISAGMAAMVRPHISYEIVVLSSIVMLIPGMKFTTGLAELAKKSLIAGAGRLMDAMVTFLSIGFGIALAIGLAQAFHVSAGEKTSHSGLGLGLAAHATALVVSSLTFVVLFSIPRKWLWATVVSGATGYLATALATRTLPAHLAAFVAALSVCTLANGLARFTQRPAQLFQVPGMMLLVPGSFGFLSLGDFLRDKVIEGATKGFQMVLIAGALVMGVLLSNLVLPPRKLL